MGQDVVRITVSDTERTVAEASRWLGRTVQHEGDMVQIEGENGQSLAAALIRHLTLADIEVRDVTVQAPSLDDVFVHLTGHAIREESSERLSLRMRHRLRR